MDSYGRPIGGRWTVDWRGVDPGNRICLRTRMETVEGYFLQAQRMSLNLQTVGFQPHSQIRGRTRPYALSSSGANRSRHLAGLHLLMSIDEKVIETFNAN